MMLITREILADEAPKRFLIQYGGRRDVKSWRGVTNGEMVDSLNALLTPIDADEVDRIIGNGSWTRVPTCDDCGQDGLAAVMQVGQEPDYESSTAHICQNCLLVALNIIGKVTP